MSLSITQKLGLEEPKPTNVSLQLADRSITYPRGIVEDVLDRKSTRLNSSHVD